MNTAGNSQISPRRIILKNGLSPGDIVMLSAAVRDLHLNFPGEFITDVRTSCPELWENNPNLTSLLESAPGVELLECHYPLINYANQTPYHSLNGFIEFLNNQLNIRIRPTEFHGDIHLSELEKSWFSQVHELTGADIPFWIIVAGGKRDITIKWWSSERFQEVVDHFRGRIQFVQVGETHHHHPLLDGVIDLRGKTDLRQLVRLVHHSQGVLCGVTALMHLAAAVERKDTGAHDRPCVVVAGGREPPHWEAYPSHQFLHTVGMLPCSGGGCWRDRTQPLGDGDERDRPEHICLNVIGELPRCMDMITATDVIRSVERYFTGGAASYLTPAQATLAAKAVTNLREKVDRGSLPKNRTLSKPLESQLTANNSPLDRVEDRSELILVTLNDATMAPVAEITSARKRKYAVRHGYGFVHYEQLLDSTRHPAWNKLLAVREVLLTGRSDWVMWMDADALPMNLSVPATSLLGGDFELIFASDFNGLNSGVFFVRNSKWALQFLEAALTLGDTGSRPDEFGPKWEQATIKHLLAHFPELARRCLTLPQSAMNTYISDYTEGDFVLHLGARPNEERLEILRQLPLLDEPQ